MFIVHRSLAISPGFWEKAFFSSLKNNIVSLLNFKVLEKINVVHFRQLNCVKTCEFTCEFISHNIAPANDSAFLKPLNDEGRKMNIQETS